MADQNQFLSPKFTVHFNEMTIITYKNRHLQRMANQFLILISTTADWYSYNMNIIHQVQAGVVLGQKLDEMHNKAWSMQYIYYSLSIILFSSILQYQYSMCDHEYTDVYCITRIIGEPYIWRFTLKMLLTGLYIGGFEYIMERNPWLQSKWRPLNLAIVTRFAKPPN